MILNALKNEDNIDRPDFSKGMYMIGFSIAVSIDALAAGFGISSVDIPKIFAIIMVGTVSLVLAIVGIKISEKISDKLGKNTEIAGGVVLILLALRILFKGIL